MYIVIAVLDEFRRDLIDLRGFVISRDIEFNLLVQSTGREGSIRILNLTPKGLTRRNSSHDVRGQGGLTGNIAVASLRPQFPTRIFSTSAAEYS